ncbi:MAG: hypothetical protein KBT68_01785 [bacterium]|nr:hypothetical protein [Candidatus Colisoma equi]
MLARFEESRIKTERTGDHLGVAVEERDGREAPPSKLGGTGWDEPSRERGGAGRTTTGGTPAPPMMGRVGRVGRVGRLGEGQQADDSKAGGW